MFSEGIHTSPTGDTTPSVMPRQMPFSSRIGPPHMPCVNTWLVFAKIRCWEAATSSPLTVYGIHYWREPSKNTWGINRLMSSLVFSSIFSIKWWPKNVTFYEQHDWTMKWILDLLRHFHWIIPKLQCSGPSFLIHTRPLLPCSNGCNTHPYDSAFHSQMDESYLVLWLKIRLSTPNRLITDPVSF